MFKFTRESLRTLSLAGGTGLMIIAGIGSYALATGAQRDPSPPAQFDRYLNLGSRAGTVALTDALNREHPAGTDLVPLLARLERAGFDCRPDSRAQTTYECSYQRMLQDRRVARIEARVRTSGMQVVSVSPSVASEVR